MSTLVYTESTLQPETAVLSLTILAGDGWFHPINKGQILRIVDLEGNQAADTFFFSAADATERYSAQDTIREQGSIYLTDRNETDVESLPRDAHDNSGHLWPA